MVYRSIHPSIWTHPASLIYHTRCRRYSVHQVLEQAIGSCQSHEEGCKVGAYGPHYSHVFLRDDSLRPGPQYGVDLIHRRPRVSIRWRRIESRALWVPVPQHRSHYCHHYHVPLEPMARRWPFGESHPRSGGPGVQCRSTLQLYRCLVIYSMNRLAVAFPFLMYLVSIGTAVVSLAGITLC